MAWTAPRTWVTGETVTAALMNTHIKDNFLSIGPTATVVKQTDETVVTSTTLQDDDELLWAMGATESWVFHLGLWFTESAGTTGDFKYAMTGPTDYTTDFNHMATRNTSDAILPGAVRAEGQDTAVGATSSKRSVHVYGSIETHGTAGNAQVQWAEDVASGTLTLHEGSFLIATHAT